MGEIKIIELDEDDVMTNDEAAAELREELSNMGVFMLNVMGGPGSGKTELIAKLIPKFTGDYKVGCMCTDLDTTLDADRVSQVCDNVIQFHTGGMWPYVSAEGSRTGLMEMISEDVNLVLLENIGVLISAAAWDTGATMNVVVVSASGGENTSLKYSYIFAIADAVIISKSDVASACGSDVEKCRSNIKSVNDQAQVFVVSSKTGEGIDQLAGWLKEQVKQRIGA